jgi:DNA polymerase-1
MALLPGYKAQRPAMPDALADQIEEIGEYLQGAGIPSLCREGVEADDLIASLARAAERESMRVVIASSDKDFFQLVSPSIGLLNPADKTDQVWAAVQVREKTGVDPAQIVDWLSLIGDAVDNIPGVAGVGPKTAAELLNRFGSVAKVYERLDEIASDRLRAALAHAAADVRRNQEMIRLRDSLPDAVSVDGLAPTAVNEDRLLALFRRWGFKGMAAELGPTGAGRQADLFAPTGPAQAQESLDRN